MANKTTKKNLPGTRCHPDEKIVEINGKIWFMDVDGFRVVYLGFGTPLYRIALDDKAHVRFVAVSLRTTGLATQVEMAQAFGHSEKAQRRWERSFANEGLDGLKDKRPAGPSPKLTPAQDAYVRRWFKAGVSNVEIARRLGVSESTVRRTLKRLGLRRETRAPMKQLPLSQGEDFTETDEPQEEIESFPEPERQTEDSDLESFEARPFSSTDPLDRSLDRMLAAVGLLDDADPVFADAQRLPRVGILLAVPLLLKTGILEIFERIYGSIGPAFYGLRTVVVCLVFLALLRIKRPENLKEYNPQDLGRLLGLDRAPEVKTLRRKFQRLASFGEGMNLMRALAEAKVKRPDTVGVLYIDGHVKEYHGQEPVGKGYSTQRRLAVPARTDTWVNDVNGDPILVVPSELNDGLTKSLEPVLKEIRDFVGDDREITVVFDRGGWSTKLFNRLMKMGFHIITYRKKPSGKKFPRIPRSKFKKVKFKKDGENHTYELHDVPRVRVGSSGNKKGEGPKYVWMRQVTCLRDNGATRVITDRSDLPAHDVLFLMFHRWRQENYFKYMKKEFALDVLLEYGTDPLSKDLDHPNPEVKRIEKEIRHARAELEKAERELGESLAQNEESLRPTVRGFKIANSNTLSRVKEAKQRISELKEEKATLPKRVPTSHLRKLKDEQRLVADAIKMVAYQIESDLAIMLSDCYPRHEDEARTLLHAAFQSTGDIEVTPKELRVTLAPQSSSHRSRAISDLCEKMNELGAVFPGTDLRLRLAVELPEPVISR